MVVVVVQSVDRGLFPPPGGTILPLPHTDIVLGNSCKQRSALLCWHQCTRGRSTPEKLPMILNSSPPSSGHIFQHGCVHGEDLLLCIAAWILYSAQKSDFLPHTQV